MNRKKYRLQKINYHNKKGKYCKQKIRNHKLQLKWKELNNKNKVKEPDYKRELLIY